jgi:hypothetical protein
MWCKQTEDRFHKETWTQDLRNHYGQYSSSVKVSAVTVSVPLLWKDGDTTVRTVKTWGTEMVFSGAVVMKKNKPVVLNQKLYLKYKNLALNILLILTNTLRHPQDLCLAPQIPNLRICPTSPPHSHNSSSGNLSPCWRVHHTFCSTLHESEETFVTCLWKVKTIHHKWLHKKYKWTPGQGEVHGSEWQLEEIFSWSS